MTRRCPDDRTLIDVATGEAAPRVKDRTLGHLAVCSRCSVRYNVLRQLKRDLEPRVDAHLAPPAAPLVPVLGARGSSPFAFFSGFRLAAVLALLILVVGAGAYLAVSRAYRHSDLRSPSSELTLLAPRSRVPSAPAVFRWTPVLNAEQYDLELIDDALERVHQGSTFLINEMAVPAAVRARLVPGRAYVWTVSAKDGDSNLLTTRSGSFVIE